MGELAAGMRVKDRELRGDELAVGEDLGAEHLNEAVASGKDRRAGAAELRAGNLPVTGAGPARGVASEDWASPCMVVMPGAPRCGFAWAL